MGGSPNLLSVPNSCPGSMLSVSPFAWSNATPSIVLLAATGSANVAGGIDSSSDWAAAKPATAASPKKHDEGVDFMVAMEALSLNYSCR